MLMTSRRSKRQFKPLWDTLRDKRLAAAPTQWALDRAVGLKISAYWDPHFRDGFEPFDGYEKEDFIRAIWDALEAVEPDISTEGMYARVMGEAGCTYDEITHALTGVQ